MLEYLKTQKEQLQKQGKKGFTLMEMLIVIAIIAILIAIAIPLFTSQLNNAKAATDEANARSLYAQVQANYMLEGSSFTAPTMPATAKSGSVTYDGTKYDFSDICEELAYTAPTTTTGPVITLKTNGETYTFGGTSGSPTGETSTD